MCPGTHIYIIMKISRKFLLVLKFANFQKEELISLWAVPEIPVEKCRKLGNGKITKDTGYELKMVH